VLTELEKRAGLQPRFHARPGKHDNTGGAQDGLMCVRAPFVCACGFTPPFSLRCGNRGVGAC
jgi:hypothetical protein